MSMDVQALADGSYRLRSSHLKLDAAIAEPILAGDAFGSLQFGDATERDDRVAGDEGRTRTDTAASRGLELTREIFRSGDGQTIGVRLVLTNRRQEPVRLTALTPLRVSDPASVSVAGGSLTDWQVLRGSRQKNDIPGCFRPAQTDLDWSDATFTSSDIPAGKGVGADAWRRPLQSMVESDPFIIVHHRNATTSPGLFLGMFGQTEHLSHIRLTRSDDMQSLDALSVTCEMDDVVVEPGRCRRTHWLVLRESRDAWETVSQWAEQLAQDAGVAQPGLAPTIFCTWYFYGEDLTETDLAENLAALRRKRVPVDTFVIDNGWMTDFGTWQANDRFPSGMERAAKMIADAGFRPGIWTCPFVVMNHSPILEQHPDLVARDAEDNPCPFNYRYEPTSVFDPTAPSAPGYLHEMFQRLTGWGFTYHKMDFLRAVPNARNVRFHDATATRAEAYRRGMQAIREAVGPNAYLNACGGIYEAGLGLVDGQRSGSDTVGKWEGPINHPERPSPLLVAKQNVFRSYMNRLWHTDPDAVMLRLREHPLRGNKTNEHLAVGRLTQEQAFTILVNQYVSGGAVCTAERMAQFQEDRRALLRHVIPPITGPARPVDLWREDCPTLYLTQVDSPEPAMGTWWTLAVSNWNEEPTRQAIALAELGLPESIEQLAAYELRTQRFMGLAARDGTLSLDLPGHATRVVRLAPWRGEPIILGTDLHLTGGAAELRRVRITPQRIEAELNTPWDYPVAVAGLFPATEGPQVVRCFVDAGSPQIRLEPVA